MTIPNSFLSRLSLMAALVGLAASIGTAAPVNPPPPSEVGGILFAGASGVGHWKPRLKDDFKEYKIISEVCSGGKMSNIAGNIHSFFSYKPSIIVVQLGGNDLASGMTPEQVCDDFKTFVKTSRAALPDVKIIYMGLIPTVKRWEQAEQQQKYEQLMKAYVLSMDNMDYMDVWDDFLGSDGKPRPELFIKDGQHNNDAGYDIRVKLTRPYLQKWHAPANTN